MRPKVVSRIMGRFMLVFSAILVLPFLTGLYYSEPFSRLYPFLVAALSSFLAGLVMKWSGNGSNPSVREAMVSTVLGWSIAVILSGLPFVPELGFVDAFFEASAGLTTTGISMVLKPESLPRSLLFWRSLMQWVGGLGILTFFIAVIRESGGISRRLFTAETHKSDPGSIRPSLKKSITELWRVYGFITSVMIGTYIALGMPVFDSVLHAFSGLSTGGFSTHSASIGYFSETVQAATIPFMLLGGTNFAILYKLFQGEGEALRNSEFKLYGQIFILVSLAMILDLGAGRFLDAVFQAASIISSTGYGTMSVMAFSAVLQMAVIGVMFVGGSVGSTSGGVKIFRLKTLIEMVKTRLRSYSLPETAINEVKLDEEILDRSALHTVAVLFFTWIGFIFIGTLLTLLFDDISLAAALSGVVSAAGNMGPVYMSGAEMQQLTWASKFVWIFLMLAGRLEMLPVLAIFNRSIFPDSK
ncbi:MAG: TrkH family potassium uptake protein [Candidatus Nanohalobium sp.]